MESAARGPVFGPAAYIVVTARDVRPAPLGRAAGAYTCPNGVSSQPGDSARRNHRPSTLATETQRRRAPRGPRRTIGAMTAIPAEFRAYVAEKVDRDGVAAVERGVRAVRETDLPAGEVEVRVEWSSVNYKDGLATRADGKVARISPLIPGIDLAGEVVASDDPSIAVGLDGPRPRLRARRVAARRLRAVPARAGRLGRAARARPDAARRDGHRDGRVHRGDVRRRARGARPDARPTARCS